MDGANVDALSRWIAIRLPRRSLIGQLAALAVMGDLAPHPALAKKRRKKSLAAKQRERRKRRFDSLLSSFEPDVQGEIVGGSAVPQGTHSFTTFVQVDLGNGSIVACTGSLITPRHVLTAAHCVVDGSNQLFAADQFLTAVGRALIQSGSVPAANIWAVSAVHLHPDYDPDTISNDVAVLLLDSDVPASVAQPVALVGSNDTRFDSPGQTATVAGWGRTSGGGQASAQLLQASLSMISDTACGLEIEMVPEVNICARNVSASGCQGDSGGPLFALMAAGASAPGRAVVERDGAVGAEKKGKKRRKKKGKKTVPISPSPPPASPPVSPPVSPPPPPPLVAVVPVQVGVVSFGFASCPLGGVNVFAQLSAPEVRGFIAEVAGV